MSMSSSGSINVKKSMIVFLSKSFNSRLMREDKRLIFFLIIICLSVSSLIFWVSFCSTSFVFLGAPSAKPSKMEKSSGHRYSPHILHDIIPLLGREPKIFLSVVCAYSSLSILELYRKCLQIDFELSCFL